MKKQWPYFLLVFVLPVTAVLWWWGLFSAATLQVADRGGYYYAYLEAQGAYSKLETRQKEVQHALKQQGVETGAQITVVLSDPRTTSYKELRAHTGYIVSDQAKLVAPLRLGFIPRRRVAIASIKAHPLFAYGKTYSALLAYARENKMSLRLPTVELFNDSVLQVEMPLAPHEIKTLDNNTGGHP